MTQNLILGDKENRLLLTLEEHKKNVFTFEDAQKILESTRPSVKNIIHGLMRKNCIQRIEKGKYLLIPSRAGYKKEWAEDWFTLVSHLANQYYVGFWTALNYWGMTEQIPYIIFIITTKRKRNLQFGHQKFQFVRFSKKKFFGYIEQKHENTRFNISTREKTIVDGLMYPQYCGKISELAKAIWNSRKEINWKSLYEMAKKIGVNVVLRRLGYLIRILKIEDDVDGIINEINKEEFKGYHYLDPTGSWKRIEYSKQYGLIINRNKEELLGWLEH